MSPAGALVRRHDPDRFLTALFAPPDRRETLFVLYAFNHELARAREAASEPAIALMRLQWWREVVEGGRRAHATAAALHQALEDGALARDDLLAIIEAREAEAEPEVPTLSAWHDYLMGSAGGVAVAAARALGAADPERMRRLGAAFGAAGVLRSVRFLAHRQRCLLPSEILALNGASVHEAIANPDAASVRAAERELARCGLDFLDGATPIERGDPALPAALVAVLARRDLRRAPDIPAQRSLADRVAVIRAGLFGFRPG